MLTKQYRNLAWYLRRHGIRSLLQRIWGEVATNINNKEYLYLIDLAYPLVNSNQQQCLRIESHTTWNSIPNEDILQLEIYKSRERIKHFLNRNFDRKGTLWLVKKEDLLIGLEWTFLGGLNGFYSLPVSPREAIILAVEVFPEFRGKGYWPNIAMLTFNKLKNQGITRIYLKTHVSNRPMQASMRKVNCQVIGLVRTFSIGKKYLTIWDKDSLWQDS